MPLHRLEAPLIRLVRLGGIFLAVGLVLGSLTAQASPAARPLGSVKFIHLGLTVLPPHQSASRGRLNEQLFAAYGLRTQVSQRATVGFADGSALHMNQRTDIVLRSARSIFVNKGEIAAFMQPGARQISTATAVASIVGTEFDVRIGAIRGQSNGYGRTTPSFPSGTTTVSVVKGVVVVANRLGQVRVTAGHWTHVVAGRPPTPPTTHNAQADVAWTRGMPSPPA